MTNQTPWKNQIFGPLGGHDMYINPTMNIDMLETFSHTLVLELYIQDPMR